MSEVDSFSDTNVLLYLLSKDAAKADRAEALLASGGVVSVQVLNEFASTQFIWGSGDKKARRHRLIVLECWL